MKICENLYHYRAVITQVHDGDTCTADIDLGMGVQMRGVKIRLRRIDAPELPQPTGIRSRDALSHLILNKEVLIRTYKDKREKYGRLLATLWLREGDDYFNLNDFLVEKGYAELLI